MAPDPVGHSDLEVYTQPAAHSNLEVNKEREEQDTYKEAQGAAQPEYAYVQDPTPGGSAKRICGLPPKRFYIIAAIVILVILAAAIGGGVGGSLANNGDDAAPAASSSATAALLSTSSTFASIPVSITPAPTTQSIVTVTTAYASTTLYPDCPSSNNTLYTAANSDSFLFRKICADAYLNADNGFGSVNEQAANLDDCIGLCVAYNVRQQGNISTGVVPVCNAVCWRATIQDDDYPGQCFGFRTQNSSSQFVLSGDSRCDSAAWINQVI